MFLIEATAYSNSGGYTTKLTVLDINDVYFVFTKVYLIVILHKVFNIIVKNED